MEKVRRLLEIFKWWAERLTFWLILNLVVCGLIYGRSMWKANVDGDYMAFVQPQAPLLCYDIQAPGFETEGKGKQR